MANWFHRFFNPHCPDCALELRDKQNCNTCEVLREMVARLESENHDLRDRLLNPPVVVERTEAPVTVTRPNRPVPWAIKRQMLETESKIQAQLLRQAPKPDDTVEKLEEELDLASAKREGKKS